MTYVYKLILTLKDNRTTRYRPRETKLQEEFKGGPQVSLGRGNRRHFMGELGAHRDGKKRDQVGEGLASEF